MRTALSALVLSLVLPALVRAAPRPVLEVAATLPDLAALAQQVAGPRARVVSLLREGEDPAAALPRPDQVAPLQSADLLIALGGPLESGWLRPLLAAASNPRLTEYLEVTSLAAGKAPGSYPLGDPRVAAQVAQAVAEQLGLRDPPGASAYRRAAEALVRDLDRRARLWLVQLAPLRGQKVLCYGDSFHALLAWAGLHPAATLSPGPGVPPDAAGVLRAMRLARQVRARLILSRDFEPARTLRLLRDRTSARLVVLPLGARHAQGERYADALSAQVQGLLQLSGRGGP